MSKDSKSNTIVILVTLYSISIIGSISRLMSILLSSFSAQFPDALPTTINLLYTLPNITTMISSLLFGPIVGKKVGFKPVFIIGLSSYLVLGFIPYFLMNNLTAILVCRALIGISGSLLGFCLADIMAYFGAEKGGTYLSLSTSVGSIGTLVLTTVLGRLASKDLRSTFLMYLLAIIPLILVIFCYKDKPQEEPAEVSISAESVTKGSFIKDVLPSAGAILALFVFYVLNSTMTLNISTVSADNGFDVSFTSFMFSAQTVGAIIAGALFGLYNKITKRYCMSITFLLLGASCILLITFKSQILYLISYLIFGISSTWIYPLTVSYGAAKVKPTSIAFMTSLFTVATSLAFFLGNYWLSFAAKFFGKGDYVYAPIRATAMVAIAIGIVLIFINPMPKELRKNK